MATDYRRFLLRESPAWLIRGAGGAWLQAIGDAKDALVQRAREGVKARLPSASTASDDALGTIGRERQIPRAPGETAEDYARRLRTAWDIWPWAGTPFGMLIALSESSYTGARLTTWRYRYALDADAALETEGSTWSLDEPDPDFWSAFELMWIPPLPTSWGGVVPGDSSAQADFVRRMVNLWKPGHATCVRIIIYEAGELWGWPEGLWSDSGTWGSATVTYWSV